MEGKEIAPDVLPDEAQKTETEEEVCAENGYRREPNEADRKSKAKGKKKIEWDKFFSAKKIAVLGTFTALAYVVMLLDFSIFPATPFLKLDFSSVFVMLVGFAFGPVEGGVVLVLKEVLHIPVGTTGGVGELANICMGFAYIIVPSVVYYFKKGIKIVIPTLFVGVMLQIGVSLLCNRYINFPLYMQGGAAEAFAEWYPYIIAFNAIKGVANSVLCVVLYKYLSKMLKKLKIK